MSTVAIVILVAVAGLSVAGYYLGWNLPNQYRSRTCQGRAWRREFSASSNDEIREFLSIFAKGFAFRARDRLKFAPRDQLLQIYRGMYPSKWQPDALELEALATLIERRYGVALANVWKDDLTLGQLFSATRANDA